MPARDDWEMAPLIVKAHTGGLTFHDFFVQQQESRTFFPKIIFVLLGLGRHWDVRAEIVLSLLLCSLTAAGIFVLLRQSGFRGLAGAGVLLLITPLLFSPTQHELWLLASGFPSFVPALCIVAGLVVVQSRLGTPAKFAVCAAFTIFSSFTLANGLLALGLTFPVLFLRERKPQWLLWLAAWLLLCALVLAAYFYEYKQPVDLPAFAPQHTAPAYAAYILAFLGSPLGRSYGGASLQLSTVIGIVALAVYVASILFIFRRRELRERSLPWIALGAYSIACALLAALGRIGWGVTQALESRYVAFGLYLVVADVALIALIAAQSARRVGVGVAACACFYLVLNLLNIGRAVPEMQSRGAVMRLAHGAVLFSQVIDTSNVIERTTYPRAWFVRLQANELNRLQLLRPPLVRETEVEKLRHADATGDEVSGWIDGISQSEQENEAVVHGWALLEEHGRPADCIALAHATGDGKWKLFRIADAIVPRSDVAAHFNDNAYRHAGWRATFPRNLVPPGATISAWAVDLHQMKLFRLKTNVPNLKL